MRWTSFACALSLATPAAAQCLVRSTAADVDARVAPAGAASFPVKLRGLPFLVEPSTRGRARVHAQAPLAFVAEARDLEYWISSPVDALGGLLRLRPWARLTRVRRGVGGAMGTARIGISVRVGGVRVACESLSLDVPRELPPEAPLPPPASDDLFAPRGTSIVLSSEPGGGETFRVHGQREELVLEDLGRRGAFRRVRFRDGESSVEGWARIADLQPSGDATLGIGLEGTGDGCGFGSSDGGGVFEGLARVETGTVVFAARGHGPWAVVRTEDRLRVRHRRGEAFAQVLVAGGLSERCFQLQHAWVATSAVQFPPEAGLR